MSKTINPISHVIIREWIYEYLESENEFSIEDILDHVPMSEYECEDNFEELFDQLIDYTINEIEEITTEQGIDPAICTDFRDDEDDWETYSYDMPVKADKNHLLNIPKVIVDTIIQSSKNLVLGCFGNEVIICDAKNPALKDAKEIIKKNPLSYWKGNEKTKGYHFIRMDFRKYFEEPSDDYNIFYDDSEKVIHILN